MISHNIPLLLNPLNTNKRQQPNLTLNTMLSRRISSSKTRRPEQLVHFLQGAALGLGHEENHVQDTDDGDAAEEDECSVRGGADEGGCGRCNGKVV